MTPYEKWQRSLGRTPVDATLYGMLNCDAILLNRADRFVARGKLKSAAVDAHATASGQFLTDAMRLIRDMPDVRGDVRLLAGKVMDRCARNLDVMLLNAPSMRAGSRANRIGWTPSKKKICVCSQDTCGRTLRTLSSRSQD